MDRTLRPRSPKRLAGSSDASTWYRYYAGYSASFVEDVLDSLALERNQLVADPWNGGGTTTQVADKLGLASWGGDINPAMVVVAKARLLSRHVSPSELSLSDEILTGAESSSVSGGLAEDPLRSWFTQSGCESVRSLERRIARFLDPDWRAGPPNSAERIAALSSLAAFFYLALFRTVKELLLPFRSSNPTWIRRPKDNRLKLSPSASTLHRLFRRHIETMVAPHSEVHADRHSSLSEPSPIAGRTATITVATSANIPLQSASVAAVVSSPPYCTRIDYAVATAPELAVLGVSDLNFRKLRETMMGSSTVTADVPLVDPAWGSTCAAFLAAVAKHPSKASSTYYLRNHLQYFDRLSRSLAEIDRILRPEGPCVLVVQDSHYKELHNDLPSIVAEMAGILGWSAIDRHDYQSKRHMGRVHKDAKKYRAVTEATESVLVFTTAA